MGYTTIKGADERDDRVQDQDPDKAHETFAAGHIHEAAVGVAGPIVVPPFVAPAPPTSARQIKQRGIATPNAGTSGAELCQTPSAFYVNNHTTAFPGGAIRGQLH